MNEKPKELERLKYKIISHMFSAVEFSKFKIFKILKLSYL